jgi:hypothetical protein
VNLETDGGADGARTTGDAASDSASAEVLDSSTDAPLDAPFDASFDAYDTLVCGNLLDAGVPENVGPTICQGGPGSGLSGYTFYCGASFTTPCTACGVGASCAIPIVARQSGWPTMAYGSTYLE